MTLLSKNSRFPFYLGKQKTWRIDDREKDLGSGGSQSCTSQRKKKITVKIEFHKPPGRLSDLIAIALDLLSILYRGQGCAHGPQWTAKV